eukprot:TRINITY_DN10629_c0_g1_i2.p1 TRINITY_DN10629_c0_g1~~TRINITY_DN10629_c0_g1_i2.p1  ORF type:complete len:129 (-),score=12.52 TRINITY_DN10629_c0_g1_i2:58-387(-)
MCIRDRYYGFQVNRERRKPFQTPNQLGLKKLVLINRSHRLLRNQVGDMSSRVNNTSNSPKHSMDYFTPSPRIQTLEGHSPSPLHLTPRSPKGRTLKPIKTVLELSLIHI